jgi:hypothetical protein
MLYLSQATLILKLDADPFIIVLVYFTFQLTNILYNIYFRPLYYHRENRNPQRHTDKEVSNQLRMEQDDLF